MFKKATLIYGDGVIARVASIITVLMMAAPLILVWKLVF